MPQVSKETGKNPIFTAGALTTEAEIDPLLLDAFKKSRPKKPFFKQGVSDKVLFIEQMDKFQEK